MRLRDAVRRSRKEYVAGRARRPEQLAAGETRRMDCIDCHNRPAHTMAATPERAVNEAIAQGRIPRDAAVHPPRGGRRAACRLSGSRRRAAGASPARCASAIAPIPAVDAPAGRAGGDGAQGAVGAERLSGDEGDVGHLSESPRPHRHAMVVSAATTTTTRRRTAR